MRRAMLLALLLFAWNLGAQQDRVVDKIDTHRTVILKGNVSLEAQPRYDQGPAETGLKITGMTLMLKNHRPGKRTWRSCSRIFVGTGNALVPAVSGHRGQAMTLFMTGEGDVSPVIATGASPPLTTPLDQLPSPRLAYSLTVGGVAVTPDFIGIPYYLVGATQINFTIPQKAPLGSQPVVVTVGDNSSAAAKVVIQ